MGLVQRVHGDLHLGNIVLIDDKPVLFDAIEFSDVVRPGDVFYDLAFLLMDLDRARDRWTRRTSCSTATSPRRGASDNSRCTRDAAVLSVDARGDPRESDRGAA